MDSTDNKGGYVEILILAHFTERELFSPDIITKEIQVG